MRVRSSLLVGALLLCGACSASQPAKTVTVLTRPPAAGSSARASATSATPSPTPSAPAATKQNVVSPFNADGSLAAGYSLKDVPAGSASECTVASPAAQGPHTLACSPSALMGGACWQSPLPGDSPYDVICLNGPWDPQLRRMRVGSVHDTSAPQRAQGLGIELTDGSHWTQAFGDHWQMMPDGYSGFMNCVSGCTQGEALMTKEDAGIDTSTPLWTVYRAMHGDAQTPPKAQQVKQIWFIKADKAVVTPPAVKRYQGAGISAQSAAQVDSWPVADDFKAFLKQQIQAGTKGNCAPRYDLDAYRADGYAVGNAGTTCTGGGAAIFWAKKDGKWMTVGATQAQLPCADLEAVKYPSALGVNGCLRGQKPETYDQA